MTPAETGDDEPVPLSKVPAIFFPHGGVTLSTLRTEARKGRLEILLIGGKAFATPKAIREMLDRCRVRPEMKNEHGPATAKVDSTSSGMTAQEALMIRLSTPSSRFRKSRL